MKYNEVLSIPLGLAVCYSGYRDGQKPGDSYPSYEQVKEDLLIVQKQWNYIAACMKIDGVPSYIT